MATIEKISEQIEQKRRLDRSLDKPTFNMLPQEDRNLVYQLRNAMEGVHHKVEALKDGIDNSERNLSREATLRKAAEERLDKLVDMYGDPAVNEELKQRLPRAANSNNREKWIHELEAMGGKMGRAVSFDDLDSHNIDESKPRSSKSRSKSADGNRRRRQRTYSSEYESEAEYGPRDHSPRRHRSGFYPPTAMQYAAPPYMPPMYGGGYPPMMMPHPQMMYGTLGGTPSAQHVPTPSNVQATESSSTPQSASALLIAEMSADQSDDKHRELNRRINMLLEELDRAKALNEKLQGQLGDTERELAGVKVKQHTREAELEAQHSGKITALVEEIYAAQKKRDEAILNRLRTANEERDEALLKLQHLQANLQQIETDNLVENVNMQDVLSRLREADTSEQIRSDGQSLVEAINSTLRRHRQVGVEEMRAVLNDRDNAVTQAKKLESEVLRLQRQMKARDSEQDDINTANARLLATQQERDIVLSKCHKLEEEVQTLQVYYSLHKSLSQEANLREQFNESLDNLEDQIKDRDHVLQQMRGENARMAQELDSVTHENRELVNQLEMAQDAQKHSAANELKLERLVNVLRRKIKGLGSADD